MSDSTPGAATITRRPCSLETCAVVLGISTNELAESVAHDDGGPGVYVPKGMYSMETAGQRGIWDAYGVEDRSGLEYHSAVAQRRRAGDTAAQLAGVQRRRPGASRWKLHPALELKRKRGRFSSSPKVGLACRPSLQGSRLRGDRSHGLTWSWMSAAAYPRFHVGVIQTSLRHTWAGKVATYKIKSATSSGCSIRARSCALTGTGR